MIGAEKILARMGIGPDAFAGRSALITGAAQGIGEGIARLLAGRGARVALVARVAGHWGSFHKARLAVDRIVVVNLNSRDCP